MKTKSKVLTSQEISEGVRSKGITLSASGVRKWANRGAPTDSVGSFAEFYKANSSGRMTPQNVPPALRAELDRLAEFRCERELIRLRRDEARYVDRAECAKIIREILDSLRREMENAFRPIPPRLVGLSAPEILHKLERFEGELWKRFDSRLAGMEETTA